MLVEGVADIEAKGGPRASTPLHSADGPRMVRLLLEYGADVSARDNMEATPLHYAAYQGRQGQP